MDRINLSWGKQQLTEGGGKCDKNSFWEGWERQDQLNCGKVEAGRRRHMKKQAME